MEIRNIVTPPCHVADPADEHRRRHTRGGIRSNRRHDPDVPRGAVAPRFAAALQEAESGVAGAIVLERVSTRLSRIDNACIRRERTFGYAGARQECPICSAPRVLDRGTTPRRIAPLGPTLCRQVTVCATPGM